MGFTPRPDVFKKALDVMGGPALPCHYMLMITPPPAMLAGGELATKLGLLGAGVGAALAVGAAANLALMAESISIPGRQFRTTDHYIYGTARRMPVGVVYQTFMATFICTNAWVERHFFDIWHQFIMSPRSQYMEYYNDYVGTLVVTKRMDSGLFASATAGSEVYSNNPLVELGNLAANYVLDEAYPISIQSQELNWEGQTYLKLTVEFSYKSWRSEPLTAIFDDGSEVPGGI